MTGLTTADQRYYASSYGRFNTADPYQASAGPSDPGSWNRYAYVEGDPVNANDPRGLMMNTGCFNAAIRDGCGDGGDSYGDSYYPGSVDPHCTQSHPTGFLDPVLGLMSSMNCYGLGFGSVVFTTSLSGDFASTGQSKTCTGTARVLQGNSNTIGKQGGFSGQTVTSIGAAVIPSQWAADKAALAPYIGQISASGPGWSFSGIVDVIGGKPPAGFPADSNVRDDLEQVFLVT